MKKTVLLGLVIILIISGHIYANSFSANNFALDYRGDLFPLFIKVLMVNSDEESDIDLIVY